MTKPIANQQTRVLPVIIDELAEKFGHKPALLGEKQCLTFRALADRSNRYARWAIGQDLAKGWLAMRSIHRWTPHFGPGR